MKPLINTILTLALLSGSAMASTNDQNVDMSTIPPRESVQLTIYNSEDLTLVRETRFVTFKEGVNPLQFSWANTLIDPSSVDLRFLSHQGELDLIDTTFPHAKPQMLYWNVNSEFDGSALVEISYFTSGITWAADYICISDPDETKMSFEGFVRISNHSGEDYAGAQIRLVVGTINLVERVRDLARRGVISQTEADEYEGGRRNRANMPAAARQEIAAGLAADMSMANEKTIVKQGLSEYFIFTIEGTETIKNSWSKRMRLFEGTDAPFRIQYRYRPAEYGHQMVRMYLLRNDTASDLGTSPLPDGMVRVYKDNDRDGLSFLTQQMIKYVPIGQEIELNLGVDPEVIHELVRLRSWRDNFWFHDTNRRKHISLDGREQVTRNFPVSGWDDHDRWVERIRNYRDQPIDVEIRRSFHGHVEFESDLDPTMHDYQSPQFSASIGSGESEDLAYHITTHQGLLAKQNNVTLTRPE
ncbi:MAG: hypothetical protein O7G85_08275 [Planctomycetota bacterium]|nr:hypothetical protein [Planctomycetota bacterium]